jgi:hypothetical protein
MKPLGITAHDAHCNKCGSLLYAVVREDKFVHVTLGTLVDDPSIRPTAHIFSMREHLLASHQQRGGRSGAAQSHDPVLCLSGPWFSRLRKESPEAYEAYADIAPGRWIHMRITVEGQRARLYLDKLERPALVVNDMKLGPDQWGGVGIWLETGTVAYFRNLRIAPAR